MAWIVLAAVAKRKKGENIIAETLSQIYKAPKYDMADIIDIFFREQLDYMQRRQTDESF